MLHVTKIVYIYIYIITYVKCTLPGSLWSHTQLSNIREIRLLQRWKSDTSTQVCTCPSHVHPGCRPHRAMPHFVATLWTDAILSTATKHSKLWLRTPKDQMLESTQFLTQIYLYYPIRNPIRNPYIYSEVLPVTMFMGSQNYNVHGISELPPRSRSKQLARWSFHHRSIWAPPEAEAVAEGRLGVSENG